jgi:hypothetical protein
MSVAHVNDSVDPSAAMTGTEKSKVPRDEPEKITTEGGAKYVLLRGNSS